MKPRPEFVLAFLLTILAALLNRPAERNSPSEHLAMPTTQRSPATDLSFTGATWLNLDDGTANGREKKEDFFRAMRWIGIRFAFIVGALLLGAFALAKRFPPLPRKPPPDI